MPAVIFIWLVGIAVGYWLCRMQLRGKFELAQDVLDGRLSIQPVESPSCPPEPPPLSQQWNLPTHNRPSLTEHSGLIRTPGCPDGFSAKQILSTHTDEHGFPKTPQYPGGLEGWYEHHGFPISTSE